MVNSVVSPSVLFVVFSYALLGLFFLPTPSLADNGDLDNGPRIPLMEEILAQTFSVSIVSQTYGSFNATLSLKSSANFPERLHGEFIPIGQQKRRDDTQRSLAHFNFPRPVSPLMSSSAAEAHPSLFRLEMQLDFSGSNRGKLRLWSLPPHPDPLEEETEPLAQVSFALQRAARGLAPFTLGDVPLLMREAFGGVELEGTVSGSFALHFFSEHEFSLSLTLPAERVWVYGYAEPSETVMRRDRGNKAPWWHTWALVGIAAMVCLMQILTAIVDARRNLKLEEAKEAASALQGSSHTPPALEGKKKN